MRHPYVFRPKVVGVVLAILTGPLSAQVSADPLDGTEWEVVTARGASLLPGTHFYIRFDEGRVTGNAGCNGFFGGYEVRGDSVAVTDVAAQKMMCHEPVGLMGQEDSLLRFLEEVRAFRLDGDRLRLRRPDGEALTLLPRPIE